MQRADGLKKKKSHKYKYNFGWKTKLFPSSQQKEIIFINSNASRYFYNEQVAVNQQIFDTQKKKHLSAKDQITLSELKLRRKNLIQTLKAENYWLRHKNIDSLALNNSIRTYQAAWNMYKKVKSAGIPQFRKKSYEEKYQTGNLGTFMYDGSVRMIDNHHMQVPKLGVVKIKPIAKKIMANADAIHIATVTISRDKVGDYYLSMQLMSDKPFVNEFDKTGSIVGIDLNLENFYTDSNGETKANPRFYRKQLNRLHRKKRTMSLRENRAKREKRNKRFAKNYQKKRIEVAKLERKIARQRKTYIHNLTSNLVKNHDLIVTEDLRSKNMLRNHALAMSIQDVGWRIFISQVEYKAALYGKKFVAVDPKNTTQTCSSCGYVMAGDNKLTLADRKWTCPACHTAHIRDHNAAINILKRGKQLIA